VTAPAAHADLQAAHDFTFYSQAKRGELSVTDRVSREELTLPLWSNMDEAVLDRVSAGVAASFGGEHGCTPATR
jgi:dTDP-4-amino-4,6-dideoxygalactose transaminase